MAAYLEAGDWAEILLASGLSTADVRDSYDAVIHLVTAADGAEWAYTTANNQARRETPDEARALDQRTMAAWVGHPHLRVLDNSTDFEGKLARTVASISRVLGLPEPVEIERKFLLRRGPDAETLEGLGARQVEIEQTYLRPLADGSQIRLRRRGIGRNACFFRTTKKHVRAGVRIETELRISGHEYELALADANPERRPIRKIRHCFVWSGRATSNWTSSSIQPEHGCSRSSLLKRARRLRCRRCSKSSAR